MTTYSNKFCSPHRSTARKTWAIILIVIILAPSIATVVFLTANLPFASVTVQDKQVSIGYNKVCVDSGTHVNKREALKPRTFAVDAASTEQLGSGVDNRPSTTILTRRYATPEPASYFTLGCKPAGVFHNSFPYANQKILLANLTDVWSIPEMLVLVAIACAALWALSLIPVCSCTPTLTEPERHPLWAWSPLIGTSLLVIGTICAIVSASLLQSIYQAAAHNTNVKFNSMHDVRALAIAQATIFGVVCAASLIYHCAPFRYLCYCGRPIPTSKSVQGESDD